MDNRCYTGLMQLPTFEARFAYLQTKSHVAADTFGEMRYLCQEFYRSAEWKRVRAFVIARDNGCDLAIPGREIIDEFVVVHHIIPLTPDDIRNCTKYLFDPEYLITISDSTHKALHYGGLSTLGIDYVERQPNDTCPWRNFL